ncbi:hypothetical protein OsI_09822 [Oryza sativa Indica Group]|uniref:Cation/H+ exchanger transmembrane domain-containing protein n=1 Tax=Oryza sativa subsp. indica TaxID=39946 RepID=B8AMC7_ORYSI|nr:hypothetical protein OsI_09822 [Oryza sativa Indica Group]
MAPAAAGRVPLSRRRSTAALLLVALALVLGVQLRSAAARPDKEMREKFYGKLVTNGSGNATGDGSIAEMFGRVLDKEFSDSDTPEAPDKSSFNNSISDHQVETFAQFGVVFLLFALGLEFSLTKLKAVGPVAVIGGLLQIVLFMFLCGLTAALCGAKSSEGVFVGAFLSMSSTAVVSKFLVEKGSTNALHGQVTIGTLILQDCAVGLLFALLPVLGGASGIFGGVMSMAKLLLVLSVFITVAYMMTWSFVPRFLKLMIQLSSQTNELYQLASVAFCLLLAWCSDYLGLSLELGSFLAGVMISTTDFAHHTLEQVEPIRNLFAALFLASIGMLIHVKFLWNHVDILLAAVILVIIVKSVVVTVVVKAFGYSIRTAFVVGLSLAQIGEFAFVLLSRASHLHLVGGKMYLLLLGTTALSLVTTPLIFKLIPVVMHLGILMRWFPSESSMQNELALQDKATMLEAYNRSL